MSNYRFDFEREQSFKCKLFEYDQNKHIFILVIDHIICDDYSIRLLEKELLTIYEAYCKGLQNPLEPIRKQFRDYVQSYNHQLSGARLTYHESYYEKLFNNLPPKLVFKSKKKLDKNCYVNPTDNGINPTKNISNGWGYDLAISKEVRDQVRFFISDAKISLYNFMLACYSIFLNNISNQNEFIIDTPMSTRTNEDLMKIIGPLLGTLVTRIKVDEDMSFRDFVFYTQRVMTEAMDHIYYQDFDKHIDTNWNQVATFLNTDSYSDNPNKKIPNINHFPYDLDRLYFDISTRIYEFKDGMIFNWKIKSNAAEKSKIPEICKNFIDVVKWAVESSDEQIAIWDLHYKIEKG